MPPATQPASRQAALNPIPFIDYLDPDPDRLVEHFDYPDACETNDLYYKKSDTYQEFEDIVSPKGQVTDFDTNTDNKIKKGGLVESEELERREAVHNAQVAAVVGVVFLLVLGWATYFYITNSPI